MLLKIAAVLLLACLSATSTLLMRDGGRDLDFSQGLWHIVTQGYVWWGGMLLGWVCGLAYALLLTKWEVSVISGVFIPLVYVFMMAGAALWLHEPLSTHKAIGSVLVVGGLLLLLKP